MGAPKKTYKLSKTGMSYCDQWLKEQIYDRKYEFTSKYTQKGTIMEDEAIDFASEFLGYGFLMKNDKRFSNKFMEGEPDVLPPDEVWDIKNSWDCFTFPLLLSNDDINHDYWWQLQGYMSLTDRKKAKLIYTLLNTPQHLIEKAAYYYAKDNGYEDVDVKLFNEFETKMTYDNIPNKHRIKVFHVERNDEQIKEIENMVMECREYIKFKYSQIK